MVSDGVESSVASWQDHFEVWHKIRKTNLSPIEEDGGILAGREAEDKLRVIVSENYSFRGCHSFAAKRLPDPRNRRRREIDLIVVTAKRLYVIECKNWGGSLTISIDRDRWIQKTSTGRTIEHENVLSLNTLKMKLLVEYLRNRGISIEPDRVCQKLILMNKSLRITSGLIAKNLDVITPDRLEEYLAKENNKLKPHEQLFSSAIGLLLDEELKGKVLDGLEIERVGGQNHDQIIEEIGKIATWDKIFLHGTKILTGDIIDRYLPSIYQHDNPVTLDQIKEIRIVFSKFKWGGFAKALFRLGRPISLDLYGSQSKLLAKTSGDPSGVIEIQEAGSPTRTRVNLCEIDRIVFGKHIIASTDRKAVRDRPIKTLIALAICGGLLITPSVRNSLSSTIANLSAITKNGWLLANDNSTLNSYTGNYDFGRYAVKISRQKDRLFAETADGKAKLQKTQSKAGNEFTVASQKTGNLGKYLFIKDRQGKIKHLIWIQTNGEHRKCPKI
ncbi:nuclease-related domain-containing protein [Chamaesiphon sp. VAR_48_metabat_135_sub]|uniref:nuclease-related domain-containing protein n=1 Tax=Chamaesiphon sp. VAR_48_metabat_135_sub TaxID=2964699 RepID=UPI00286AB449|nr:nuclease-related domain-containing protein [Chamaesiphon sp. VAR_48_metabat_135_sub]